MDRVLLIMVVGGELVIKTMGEQSLTMMVDEVDNNDSG